MAEKRAEHLMTGVGVSVKIPTWDNGVGNDLFVKIVSTL